MRIHLFVNKNRGDALACAQEAATWLENHGVDFAADKESAARLGMNEVADCEMQNADFVVCFGGDGTVIRASHLCSERGTPILGVHFGRFGFVTQCAGSEVQMCLSAMADGKVEVEPRMMLQAELLRGDATIATMHALNEISLQRAVTARMLVFQVVIDDQEITRYPADGIVVATPTGSTAYNLSAGGPIVDPSLNAVILTAVAPHTLSARPLVLPPASTVLLRVETEGDAVLSADSQTRLHLLSGDQVKVRRSPRVTNLVRVDPKDFLIKLNERLLWGQWKVPGDAQ